MFKCEERALCFGFVLAFKVVDYFCQKTKVKVPFKVMPVCHNWLIEGVCVFCMCSEMQITKVVKY